MNNPPRTSEQNDGPVSVLIENISHDGSLHRVGGDLFDGHVIVPSLGGYLALANVVCAGGDENPWGKFAGYGTCPDRRFLVGDGQDEGIGVRRTGFRQRLGIGAVAMHDALGQASLPLGHFAIQIHDGDIHAPLLDLLRHDSTDGAIPGHNHLGWFG